MLLYVDAVHILSISLIRVALYAGVRMEGLAETVVAEEPDAIEDNASTAVDLGALVRCDNSFFTTI